MSWGREPWGWGRRAVSLGTAEDFVGRRSGFPDSYLTSRDEERTLATVRVAKTRRRTRGKLQGGPRGELKGGRKVDWRHRREAARPTGGTARGPQGPRRHGGGGGSNDGGSQDGSVASLERAGPGSAAGLSDTVPPVGAAGHCGRGPEELDGFGRTVTRGRVRVRTTPLGHCPPRSAPVTGHRRSAHRQLTHQLTELRTVTGSSSTPHGSSTSSTQRSHSSSKVVWAMLERADDLGPHEAADLLGLLRAWGGRSAPGGRRGPGPRSTGSRRAGRAPRRRRAPR